MKQKYDCNRDCSTCAYNDNSDYLRRTMQKEEIYDKLRQNGCRITKQRQTLIDIIIERECNCCKEIYYIASKKLPEIGLATIYRMINVLEEVGAIRRENMYRVCTPQEDATAEECVVRLENEQEVELDKAALQKIIERGMEACGYLNARNSNKVKSILLKSCSS